MEAELSFLRRIYKGSASRILTQGDIDNIIYGRIKELEYYSQKTSSRNTEDSQSD